METKNSYTLSTVCSSAFNGGHPQLWEVMHMIMQKTCFFSFHHIFVFALH